MSGLVGNLEAAWYEQPWQLNTFLSVRSLQECRRSYTVHSYISEVVDKEAKFDLHMRTSSHLIAMISSEAIGSVVGRDRSELGM